MCIGADVCYVHRELLNGVLYTTWNCLRESETFIDLVCNHGAFNSDIETYACCSDIDNCNENLEIVLPIEVPTEQMSFVGVPSPTTLPPRPSPTFAPMIITSSITQPLPLLVSSDSSPLVQSTKPDVVVPSTAAMQPATSLVPESTTAPTISSSKGMHCKSVTNR